MIPPTTTLGASGGRTASRESSEFEFVGANNGASNPASSSSSGPSPPAVLPSTPETTITAPLLSTQDSSGTKTHPEGQPVQSEDTEHDSGLLGWIVRGTGGGILSKVAEKTKSSMESVITTLDPQMKEYIRSGGQGDLLVVVASDKDVKVGAMRKAFQNVFGRATVFGVPAQGSTIADQPLGFAAGRQAAQERLNCVKAKDRGDGGEALAVVAVEGFLLEVNDDDWVEMSVLVLNDDANKITLTAYTQPTKVATSFVNDVKDATSESYPKRWSGFAKTIGQAIEETNVATRKDWHQVLGGIPRSELIQLASASLAYQYQKALSTKVNQTTP